MTPPEAIGDVLADPPTARRSFASADRVAAVAKVYQTGGSRHGVTVTCRVLDRNERQVRAQRVLLEAGELIRGAADVKFGLPLGDLPLGAYDSSSKLRKARRRRVAPARARRNAHHAWAVWSHVAHEARHR